LWRRRAEIVSDGSRGGDSRRVGGGFEVGAAFWSGREESRWRREMLGFGEEFGARVG